MQVNCISCGIFTMSGTAVTLAESFSGERWKASSWLRHNGQNQLLNSDGLKALADVQEPSMQTKALIALRYFSKKHPKGREFLFSSVSIDAHVDSDRRMPNGDLPPRSELIALTWSESSEALLFLFTNVLVDAMAWVKQLTIHQKKFQITPKGWLALESKPDSPSQVGFCAMWFNDEVRSLWTDCIEPAILSAGYEPLRIDGKQHNNKIDDEIIASIRQAKFVVSDLTGNRGGVYYEAGFAHGLGLPVIFMCRRSDDDKPHFDIQQYNTIFWSDDEEVRGKTGALSKVEARKALQMRIESTMGKGTYAPSK
jgi:nucleoside 2-deoxyribosyltransferase